MSVLEQLRMLHRLFPRALELAASAEMIEAYKVEMCVYLRYMDLSIAPSWPVERFASVTLQKMPFMFRNVQLTMVTRT